MSQYLDNMAIGDAIDFRGPSGLLVYKGNGMTEHRCCCCQQMSLWYSIKYQSTHTGTLSLLIRSVRHPAGQEVRAKSSEV